MSATFIVDDEEDILPIPIGSELRAWLAQLSRDTGAAPGILAASILDDVRRDDEATERTIRH
jgi:hypothetical protein